MMLKKNEKGFTLIELLIVVAIIGILAAIAIPQFAAYRIRAFNGAGNADIKNARTAQEALFADFQTYGKTEGNILLNGVSNAGGAGNLVSGAMAAATPTVQGCAISGARNADGAPVGVGTGVSNGVNFRADITAIGATPNFGQTSFTMFTKHVQGNRAFSTETEGTAIFFVENAAWAGLSLANSATLPGITTGVDINNSTAGGGTPITTWSAL